MAPLKFEEELKEKLEGREIKPSINAWDRITQELEEPKPKRRGFWTYGIAASLIGLLLVSIWFFNINKSNDVQEIVDTEQKEEVKIEKKESLFETNNEILVNVDEIEKPVTKEKEKNSSKERKHYQNNTKVLPKTPEIIAESAVKKEQEDTLEKPVFEDKLIEKQLNNVLEALAQLEVNNTNVSNAEVDSLLRNAQREILKGKALEAGISIDAMTLLYEAEDELDKTFRDKVLEKLKDGFQKVRTAVADRNN